MLIFAISAASRNSSNWQLQCDIIVHHLLDQVALTWLQVLPGSRIPADGKVHSGGAYVDESMITGESKPVVKRTGDEVISGSMNGSGCMIIQVM